MKTLQHCGAGFVRCGKDLVCQPNLTLSVALKKSVILEISNAFLKIFDRDAILEGSAELLERVGNAFSRPPDISEADTPTER